MTYLSKRLPTFLVCITLLLAGAAKAEVASCVGRIFNPVTDVCWMCLFPMRIGGVEVPQKFTGLKDLFKKPQDNGSSPSGLVCVCPGSPIPGVNVSFWEPIRLVEVTRAPFCMVSLAATNLGTLVPAPAHVQNQSKNGSKSSFYQAHWYANPVVAWTGLVLDFACLQAGSFDVGYMTEFDPTWADDEATIVLNPDAVLFANPIAQAACAVDCISSTANFPISALYWCDGCHGSMYPLNGRVSAHTGGVEASTLIAERMAAKMGRELLLFAGSGTEGMCHMFPQVILNKRDFKIQMTYPIPATSNPVAGCCQPLGRTAILSGAGSEFPYAGEDFVYQIWRKRDCCARPPS